MVEARLKLMRRVVDRLRKEKRWVEAEPIKDEMLKEAKRAGMSKEEAQEWAWTELEKMYPPLGNVEKVEETGRIRGLGEIPADWGKLPSTSTLQRDLGWVQANRLDVVVESPGGVVEVYLDRAEEPAPSKAALGWLETSIRSYAKYVDIVGKSLASAAEEQEMVRKEKMAVAEIRALLEEMRGGEDDA